MDGAIQEFSGGGSHGREERYMGWKARVDGERGSPGKRPVACSLLEAKPEPRHPPGRAAG